MPAGNGLQYGLHRAERVEEIDVDVGDDVGRERKRQRQRPCQRIAAGETIGGDEPRRADADDRGQRGDAGEQQHGDAQRLRDHIGDKIGPDVVSPESAMRTRFASGMTISAATAIRNAPAIRSEDGTEKRRRAGNPAPVGQVGGGHRLVIEPHLVDEVRRGLLVLRDFGERQPVRLERAVGAMVGLTFTSLSSGYS